MWSKQLILKTVILLILAVSDVFAADECYYNLNHINYAYFLKHTGFTKAEWDDDRKEARVLLQDGSGEVLVSYSACYEFGLSAKYKMKRATGRLLNSRFFIEKILWLGKKVLNKSDYELLANGVKSKQFVDDLSEIEVKKRVFVGIEGSDYQSFLIYAVDEKNEFFVEISWSM